ncbi:MAG: ABC transporter ATP-binding protein [Bifidobacteriaceae bacterium]|jgi:peptide/nickel transport system ATP-binding protein|nr:ABC transporter ATP-binding protein [Bifidobacteriaceae bacterium]
MTGATSNAAQPTPPPGPAAAPGPLVQVRALGVEFDVDGQNHTAVRSASFEIGQGEVVAVVGESGSGKTVTALAMLGLLPGNAKVTGQIEFEGRDLLALSERELRAVRGRRVGMVFQDPVAALDPVFSVGYQLDEVVKLAEPGMTARRRRQRAIDLLSLVEIASPAKRLGDYPHQFSGGQAQRIAIAMMLANSPRLIIADEPTTALDVTVQAEVLDVLRAVRASSDSAILLITHNMGVVADLADRVVVMRAGDVVENQPVDALFTQPKAPYTRELLAAVPRIGARGGADSAPGPDVADPPVLGIHDLVVEYGGRLRKRVRAVDGVDLHVAPGEILGLVGESGSGKTTVGRAVLGLAPVTRGEVAVNGHDVTTLSRRGRQAVRRTVGVVFQNPATSLNPRFRVAQAVIEPLRVLGGLSRAEAAERARELLRSVGLDSRWDDRYPHELSGGQRQRVAIARAVALDPALLIADEPTSALDVSVQAQVLDVFRELQARLGFACLFISHDLAVVDALADRVAVMRDGRIVEQGGRAQVLAHPAEPYTQRLLASAPVPDPAVQRARGRARLALAGKTI